MQFLSEKGNTIDCSGYVCAALVAFHPDPMQDQSMLNWMRGAEVQKIINDLRLGSKTQDVLESLFVERLTAFHEQHMVCACVDTRMNTRCCMITPILPHTKHHHPFVLCAPTGVH